MGLLRVKLDIESLRFRAKPQPNQRRPVRGMASMFWTGHKLRLL